MFEALNKLKEIKSCIEESFKSIDRDPQYEINNIEAIPWLIDKKKEVLDEISKLGTAIIRYFEFVNFYKEQLKKVKKLKDLG